MKDKEYYEEMAVDIREWFNEGEHYSVVHYAVERGISKEGLLKMGADSEVFKEALEYAFSVQEYKVVEGAISKALDRAVAMKLLETYNGWKGDINVYQSVSQSMTPELAERLSEAIERMDGIGLELEEGRPTDTFGEIGVGDGE